MIQRYSTEGTHSVSKEPKDQFFLFNQDTTTSAVASTLSKNKPSKELYASYVFGKSFLKITPRRARFERVVSQGNTFVFSSPNTLHNFKSYGKPLIVSTKSICRLLFAVVGL